MKLAEHVENIRKLIDKSYRNRLGRMGITLQWATSNLQDAVESKTLTDCKLPNGSSNVDDLRRIIDILSTFEKETGTVNDAYEKLVEELTFTLFNRIAAMKVMEAHTLHPEIISRRSHYGDRSFAHFLWLEQNPDGRNEENEGLVRFFEDQLTILSTDIPLFSISHPYHLLPTAIELSGIVSAFNQVEKDDQVETDIWRSDDVLGWLYESYNDVKRKELKETKGDIEYDKVRIQSCIYTPRWVVKFLVDNSLGKLYLEMYPDSTLKEKYKLASTPKTQTRERIRLTEIRMIDLAIGSGNFVLYGFDLFYDFYIDQNENYGADYNENKIPEFIIQHNLHGIDLDDRAVQLAQFGLYIKAKRKKGTAKIEHFNIVSSDFFLPDFKVVKHLFENGEPLSPELEKIVTDLWIDLQQAHKFGSLIRLEEKFSARLNSLVQQFDKAQLQIFESQTLANYDQFRENFFSNLKNAVAQNAAKQGVTILSTKTQDAITFLELLTKKYDIAVTNPPYTDSADFGKELKIFVDANYKEPLKFNSNLYASFIKRCYEMLNEKGKIALLHPLTFMYITSFQDLRKFILDKTHIHLLVELGLGGVFANSDVQADVVAYVLEKSHLNQESIFLDFKKYKNHSSKPNIFANVYSNLVSHKSDNHIYFLPQSKLHIIKGMPFIYWISDSFREKFKELSLGKVADIRAGIQTSNNNRFLRLWWEVDINNIIQEKDIDRNKKRWAIYSKGGPYNKWDGNLWCTIDWWNDGADLQKYLQSVGQDLHAQEYYFREGITYSASGSKGVSFRYLPEKCLFDIGGSSIFLNNPSLSIQYFLGLLNSKIVFYITDCLNPTVNVQPQDLKRIPFVKPSEIQKKIVEELTAQNVNIKHANNSFRIIENNYEKNPLNSFSQPSLRDRVFAYLNYENAQLALVLINEAIINQIIYEVYALNPEDRNQVESKMGKSICELPTCKTAREAFVSDNMLENSIIIEYLESLPTKNFSDSQIQAIVSDFGSLYQGNNDLEEFCIDHQLNPLNVCYWFKENKILPQRRIKEITLEFLVDSLRTILMEDSDGIIPLVGLPNEPRMMDRLEQYCLNIGFSSAQFMQLDILLGSSTKEYIEHDFFSDFCDYVKVFKQLPSTPFIWHLSSGEHQGFEVYIIIYKWNRDSLFKLKSQYLNKRVENLEYRQIQLQGSDSAQTQIEKEKIRLQLQEIEEFTSKIDELIAEGYNPKLDDGVGKNIAPLQKKELLRCDVLNKKQLETYLNADW